MYQPNFERIAQKIVRESLRVQPGEQVLMDVRTDALHYGELIATEFFREGGVVTMMTHSDAFQYHEIMETPLAQLSQPLQPFLSAIDEATHIVQVGYQFGEPERFRQLPPEREHAWNQRQTVLLQFSARSWPGRMLSTEYPTRGMADAYRVPWGQFFETFWRAMDVDYGLLGERATALAEQLAAGEHLHITTPRGTDLRLRRGGRAVLKDDGLIRKWGNLPAGEVYFPPLEESVEGRLVYDSAFHMGQHITGLEFHFEGGIGTPLRAAHNYDVFLHEWAVNSGDKNRIGEMGIGLNPAVQQATGFQLMNHKLQGTVHLGLGSNLHMGGKNQSSLRWAMLLFQPTVTVDDRPILERGRFRMF